ncbi:terpene synthase family protein [Streptomyces sp. NPDC059552]|uniref:terpene synthase family protein n=1 Tax=Streptomyces sp. NPDC059552 TaxID=3346862 RepID=UPI0036A46E02
MPEFVMPCPSAGANPAVRSAEEALRAWGEASGLDGDGPLAKILGKARPAILASLLYPQAAPAALAMSAQWLAVNFLVDDILDAEDDPERCRGTVRDFCDAFTAPASVTTGSLRAAITRLWQRTREDRSQDWCGVFRDDVRDWLHSYPAEAEDRIQQRMPTIDAYRRHRRLSSGMLVFVDLVEFAAGADLPAELRQSEAMGVLRGSTAEHMGLVNDMHSVSKEQAAGQLHNAVSLLQHHQRISLQEALHRVNDLATSCLDAFEAAAARLPDHPDAARCVQGYRLLMRGAFDCYAATDRYLIPHPGGPDA